MRVKIIFVPFLNGNFFGLHVRNLSCRTVLPLPTYGWSKLQLQVEGFSIVRTWSIKTLQILQQKKWNFTNFISYANSEFYVAIPWFIIHILATGNGTASWTILKFSYPIHRVPLRTLKNHDTWRAYTRPERPLRKNTRSGDSFFLVWVNVLNKNNFTTINMGGIIRGHG